jgi:phosphoribosyl-ATP pyrophosphohydrolase
MSELGDTLDRLWAVIDSRRGGDPAASWTAKLLADPKLAAKKLGEEAVEAAIAAATGDKAALTAEAADVLYHLLAVLAASGVTPDEVTAALKAREGTSGVVEKAGR